jgi:hypothetical protein
LLLHADGRAHPRTAAGPAHGDSLAERPEAASLRRLGEAALPR